MTFRRYGQTDYQENKLAAVEKIAKSVGFHLKFGATIGKFPQSVVLDHNYQDGIVHVSANPDYGISFKHEENVSLSRLKELMIFELKNKKPFGGVFG